jgi:imidazolonepropionase-like amidohydrolase
VLKAATAVNARALHWEQQVGAIKAGMKADIVIFSGDPTKKISDVRNPVFVMKDGVVYLGSRQ